MAFSGTVSATVFQTEKVISNAFRRCKLQPQQITSEYLDVANDQLYLILSALANVGIQLWCIEKVLLPLYNGQGELTLPVGTVDLLNQNLRTVQPATGTTVTAATTSTTTFASATFVCEVGILWAAAAAPIVFERWDGAAWVTIQTETPSAAAGEWTWFDLDSSIAATQFRVRATSGVLSTSQIVLANSWTEIPLARMNRDDWFNLPNRSFQNDQPLQFWFDRQVPQPIMHMWPVPNSAVVGVKHVSAMRQRHVMDVGTLTQEIEVPQRWYMAIVTKLAVALADEIPEVDVALIPLLEKRQDAALKEAQEEERDNSPTRWAPNISAYTR